jgi:hypothetical protein
MKHRKLRIAWSVTWGAVVVLLISFWVRSYYANDQIYFRSASILIQITPSQGAVRITDCSVVAALPGLQMGIGWSFNTEDHLIYENEIGSDSLFARVFRKLERPAPITWLIPHWLLVLAAVTVAPTPFVWPNHVSLRTLLIATTLVAIGLGLIVWAAR